MKYLFVVPSDKSSVVFVDKSKAGIAATAFAIAVFLFVTSEVIAAEIAEFLSVVSAANGETIAVLTIAGIV